MMAITPRVTTTRKTSSLSIFSCQAIRQTSFTRRSSPWKPKGPNPRLPGFGPTLRRLSHRSNGQAVWPVDVLAVLRFRPVHELLVLGREHEGWAPELLEALGIGLEVEPEGVEDVDQLEERRREALGALGTEEGARAT